MKTQPQSYSGIGTEDIPTLEHSFLSLKRINPSNFFNPQKPIVWEDSSWLPAYNIIYLPIYLSIHYFLLQIIHREWL